MPTTFTWVAPDDASDLLQALSGPDLICFYRTLPWAEFIQEYLTNLRPTNIRDLISQVKAVLPTENTEILELPEDHEDMTALVGVFRDLYKTV